MIMSLWQQVQQSLSIHAEVLELYKRHDIPIDIRHELSHWIEAQVWELDPAAFLDGLQRQLDRLPFFTNDRLSRFQTALRGEYALQPEMIQNKLQECLNEEYRLIQEEEKRRALSNSPPLAVNSKGDFGSVVEINPIRWIMQLKLQSEETEEILRQLDHFRKEFTFALAEDQKIKGIYQYQNNQDPQALFGVSDVVNKVKEREEDVHARIRLMGQSIWELNSQLESKLDQIVQELSTLQRGYLSRDIRQWKFERQRSFIGYPCKIVLNRIQELAENIVDVLWTIRQQLKRAGEMKVSLSVLSQDKNDVFPPLFDKATNLLRELTQITFIIEHQSLPIVRTDTKFYVNQWKKPLTVGSLIAQKLNPRMTPPEVRVTIINEKTLESILQHGISEDDLIGVGELTDNICSMESCNLGSPHFAAIFRHIRLKNLFESRRRGTSSVELVTDEKFFLLCTTEFGNTEKFKVWTVSSPIVVTTHWTQDCRAWGTLLWDYGLSGIDRRSLEVPESGTWPEIMEILNTFFCNFIGVPLTLQQRQCLTNKATRMGRLIRTLDELCKEPMENRKFSFWDWFYNSMKLIEKHFKKEWQGGHVIGFINKDDAGELLKSCSPGTFLLRLSDSIPGAISVAGLLTDGQVYSLDPFNTKELDNRCLAYRINDLVQFLTLYPETPKSQIFGDPCILPSSQQQPIQKRPDYWKSNQITVIDPGRFWINAPLASVSSTSRDVEVDKLIDCLLQSNWEDPPTFNEAEFSRAIDSIDTMEQDE